MSMNDSDDGIVLDESGKPRRVTYKSYAQVLRYGLLYKRDKFCRRCKAINWLSIMRQIEQRDNHLSSFPLYGKPVRLTDLAGCCELGSRIYWSLMRHPELKHDCEEFLVCGHHSHAEGRTKQEHDCGYRQCQHEAHTVLANEELQVNLVELDGDFNVEIGAPSVAYEAAVARRKGSKDSTRHSEDRTGPTQTVDNTDVARHWLRECQESHDECRKHHRTELDPPLPTRVIDVLHSASDGRPKPHLIDAQGAHGQYATLSYVWGQGARFIASQETLKQLRNCINLDALPKLFQDAIAFTRRIGIPYLWIDALCIMQDSTEDLAHELSLMTDIYRNSSLTLAAVGQRSVHNPLIRNGIFSRVSVGNDWDKSYLECTKKDGRFMTYLAFGHPATLAYPLHTRAWCLQETLLSKRTLVLGLREMYWFCNSYERRASAFTSKRQRESGDYEIEIYGPVTASTTMAQELEKRPFNFWYNTVAKYSQRKLSFPQDRLPALSGLARLMVADYLSPSSARDEGGRLECDYLAGLWRADLWHGLLWRSENNRFDRVADLVMKFSAPSWSWAAWETPVSWRRHVRNEDKDQPSDPEKDATLASVISCSVSLASPSALYGQVKGGVLVLRGRIAPLRLKDEEKQISKEREPDVWSVGDNIRKFCACETPEYDKDYCRDCEEHLNAPVLVDQTCIVLQMTRWEALILSPTFRVRRGTGPEGVVDESKEELSNTSLGMTFLRAGIMVSRSSVDLEWSEKSVVVTVI